MNRQSLYVRTRSLLFVASVIWLISFTISAIAQPQISNEGQRSTSLTRNTTTKRHLTNIETSESAEGLRISITVSSPVSDAISYRSADRFVVVIPQADVAALQVDLRGLNNFQVDKRDEDVALSFKLNSTFDAQLSTEGGRVIVTLRQDKTAIVNDAPRPLVAEFSNSTAAPAGSLTTTPATAAPQAAPSLDDIIKFAEGLFKTKSVDVANLDLNTPESPAFTVLGLNPQTIVRPASPREFATSLINGLDKNGNFQSGLAIDTAPYLLFNGQHVTLEDYNKDPLTRFLTRTQFSFAAAKGSSKDDPTTKLSLGLNFTLFDGGDPRFYRPNDKADVLACFDRELNKFAVLGVGGVPPVAPGAGFEAARAAAIAAFIKNDRAKVNEVLEQCREEGRKAHWNKDSWTVAFAPSWISKTGNSSDFKWNGGALWTSYAHGVGTSGQFILHARYRNKEQVPDPAKSGSFIIQNSAFFGGRFRMGNPDFGLNIEGAFVHNNPKNKPSKNTYEFSVGAEKKLAENVYFVVSAGSKGPQADNTKSHGFVITSFKYGFSKKPQIATAN